MKSPDFIIQHLFDTHLVFSSTGALKCTKLYFPGLNVNILQSITMTSVLLAHKLYRIQSASKNIWFWDHGMRVIHQKPGFVNCVTGSRLVLFYQGSQTPLSYYLTFTTEQRCLTPRNKTHFTLDMALMCVFSHVCRRRGSSSHTSGCVSDRYRTQYH